MLYLVVFYVAFQVILQSAVPSFPLFLLSGLLVWNLFSTGLAGATGSIVANSGIVNKVSFPREILPLAAVGAALVHFFLQGLVLVVALLVVRWDVALDLHAAGPARVDRHPPARGRPRHLALGAQRVPARYLALPRARAVAWFWFTPIVYPFMTIGSRGGWQTKLYMSTRSTPVVLVFQHALYAKTSVGATKILPDWSFGAYAAYLGLTFGLGIIVLAIGISVFGRLEANFAEEL